MGQNSKSTKRKKRRKHRVPDKLTTSDREIVMAGGLPLHLAIRFNASNSVGQIIRRRVDSALLPASNCYTARIFAIVADPLEAAYHNAVA